MILISGMPITKMISAETGAVSSISVAQVIVGSKLFGRPSRQLIVSVPVLVAK
jgi:hypothetical protein